MPLARVELEKFVLSVHRRNGGGRGAIHWGSRLLGGGLSLDSLDLAEVMVMVEKRWGVAPFERNPPPRTWRDILELIEGVGKKSATSDARPRPKCLEA